MNKISTVMVAAACLINTVAFGAAKECSYSPLQQVIRTARTEEDVMKLINNNVNLNIRPKCGGNVYQLAILRGNSAVVKALIENSKLPVDVSVSNTDYPIPGAPKEIPLAFFAAYHAPSINIMQLILNAGVDIMATDSRGETILWYLNQNPVLLNTELVDQVTEKLIMGASAAANAEEAKAAAEKAKEEKAKEEKAKEEKAKEEKMKEAKKEAKESKSVAKESKKEKASPGNVIEAEPDAPFKPEALSESEF